MSRVVQVTFDATLLREQGMSDQQIMDHVGVLARQEARRMLVEPGASQVEDDDELDADEWIPSIDDYFRPYLRWKGWSEERIDAWLAGVRQGGASSQVDEVTDAESSAGSGTGDAS